MDSNIIMGIIWLYNTKKTNEKINLNDCKKGDILISSQGAKLEYVSKTRHYTYLDHVVKYVVDKDNETFDFENYGTRTNDGFVFAKIENLKPTMTLLI
jgi:hypothetical protein